ERILYRLDELRAGIAANKTVLFVEGEKDVDRIYTEPALAARYVATTIAQGAKPSRSAQLRNLPPRFKSMLEGVRDVIVVADNDDVGRLYAETVASKALASGRAVRIISALPGVALRGDVSDFLDAADVDALIAVLDAAPLYEHTERKDEREPEYTDIDNAKRIVDSYGDRIRYVKEWDK